MILALDTDALVHWAMAGAPYHQAVRARVEETVRKEGGYLGLVPQVLHEFVHVSTDPRRFEVPLTFEAAVRLVRDLWNAPEVRRVLASAEVFPRTLELLERYRLGRKRILDAALAATLECAGVRHVLTLNVKDFEVFPFLKLVSPL